MNPDGGHILSLSTELLLLIYENLSNLDEPSYLAITCKRLYSVFKGHQNQIAWSIIVCLVSYPDSSYIDRILNMHQHSSKYHKYDVPLCYLADTMQSQDEDVTSEDPSLSNHCLDYDSIFSVTSKSVETMDLYLRRIRLWWEQANELRCRFIHDMNQYRHALSYQSIEHLPLEERQKYQVACYGDCNYQVGTDRFPLSENSEGNTVSQERFYRAVMARVLDTKALQLLAMAPKSDESDVAGSLYKKIIKTWCRNPGCSLQESLDQLEIFDYTSNFLLLKAFNMPLDHLALLDNDRKSDIMDTHETFFDNWMSFHIRLQSFLTPFDILSLLTHGTGKHIEGKNTSDYLLKFLMSNRVDDHESLARVSDIEEAVSLRLSPATSKAWKDFRSHQWRSTARGRVFNDAFDISDKIVHYEQDVHLWWKYLSRVESDSDHYFLSIGVPQEWFVPFEDLIRLGESKVW